MEVQGGVGEGNAIGGFGLSERVNQNLSKVPVGAPTSSNAAGKGVEGFLVPHPESNVPGGVVGPTVEGGHGRG